MKKLIINDWYINNVLIVSEGLKYFPHSYEIEIIDDSHEYYIHCKIYDHYDFILYYDIPRGQLIEIEK